MVAQSKRGMLGISGSRRSFLSGGTIRRGLFSSVNTLLPNLAAYWKLDEASGTRVDQLGISNLGSNNGVVSGAGPAGTVFPTGAAFVGASSQSLSVASNSNLQQSSSFSIFFWITATTASTMGIITKDDAGSNREWGVYMSGNILNFYVYDNTGAQRNVTKSAFTGTHFVVCWCDNTAKTVNLSVDNAAAITISLVNNMQPAKSAPVYLGAFGSVANFLTGTVTAMGIEKKVLSSSERTSLYNGGVGYQYPWGVI